MSTTTAEEVTSHRLQYMRTIIINLARQRRQDPNWRLDSRTMASMKSLIARMFGKSEAHHVHRGRKQEVPVPVHDGEYCSAHLARTNERKPVYQAGLCRACFDGAAVKRSENYGTGPDLPELGIPEERAPRTKSLMFALVQLEAATQYQARP